MNRARFRLPLSAIILGFLGVATLVLGVFAMLMSLTRLHHLLNADGGLALVVSGIALLLSGAFPLVLARLAVNSAEVDETC